MKDTALLPVSLLECFQALIVLKWKFSGILSIPGRMN